MGSWLLTGFVIGNRPLSIFESINIFLKIKEIRITAVNNG